MNRYRALIIVSGGKDLLRFGRDRGVLVDQFGHDTTECLDTNRQWCDVQQEHVLDLATEYTTLDRCTYRDRFVWINVLARFLAKEVLDRFLNLRHASLATDHNHILDFRGTQTRIFQCCFTRLDGTCDKIFNQ